MIQIEAIVLRALAFKEYDRILTLFSPQGLLKLFVKVKKRDYLHFIALTSPLTHAEFHYTQGKKDLHRFSEGAIIKQNLRVRERYETLMAAEKMTQALLQSQWPGKAAPKLFNLFSLFLENLPTAHNPYAMSVTFLLKTLRHEGVLQLCAPLEACSRFAGERYPLTDAPQGSLQFTEEEEALLTELALCRSLEPIVGSALSPEFQQKIETLFFQTFNN